MLVSICNLIPEQYSFCNMAYGESSFLQFGSYSLLSHKGIQKGDPFGPLLLCINVRPLLSSLPSPMVCGSMEDFTIGGPIVTNGVLVLSTEGPRFGLHINPASLHHSHRCPRGLHLGIIATWCTAASGTTAQSRTRLAMFRQSWLAPTTDFS